MAEFNNLDGPTTVTGGADRDTIRNVDASFTMVRYLNLGVNDNDTYRLGDGTDSIEISAGSDIYDGGPGLTDQLEGFGFIQFSEKDSDGNEDWWTVYNSGLTVDLAASTYSTTWYRYSNKETFQSGTDRAEITSSGTLTGIEIIVDTAGNDRLLGSDYETVFASGRKLGEFFRISQGSDFVDGRGGWDRLVSGFHSSVFRDEIRDFVVVDSGKGTWQGKDLKVSTFRNIEQFELSFGADTFVGGKQADWVIPQMGADTLSGGKGKKTVDVLDFAASASVKAGVTANMETGKATNGAGETVTFSGFEHVIGTFQRDTITGSSGKDIIDGASENDTLRGGGGNDSLIGGSGTDMLFGEDDDDRLAGGSGNDTLDGGEGSDWADFSLEFGTEALIVSLASDGRDSYGNTDTFISIENLRGRSTDDSLTGNDENNRIEGGAGEDRIDGGKGDDVLDGGQGLDRLTGGEGADVFTFLLADLNGNLNGLDVIADFDPLQDTLAFI